MVKKYTAAIKAGQIVSVDWCSIEEMLGENTERTHICSIYTDDGSFPPKAEVYSDHLTEEQIMEVLRQSNARFMAETYKDGISYVPIETRYFSATRPASGPWIENPNWKA